jgi:hypothetical protein
MSEQLLERLEKLDISENLIESDEQTIIKTSEDEVQWRFVLRCLEYLRSIQRELNAKADSEGMNVYIFRYKQRSMAYFSTLEANDLKELMGVKDMRVVHTLLEIVITWGLYPQLLRGVGLPLAQRIKSGYSNRGMERVKPLYTSRLPHISAQMFFQ